MISETDELRNLKKRILPLEFGLKWDKVCILSSAFDFPRRKENLLKI